MGQKIWGPVQEIMSKFGFVLGRVRYGSALSNMIFDWFSVNIPKNNINIKIIHHIECMKFLNVNWWELTAFHS